MRSCPTHLCYVTPNKYYLINMNVKCSLTQITLTPHRWKTSKAVVNNSFCSPPDFCNAPNRQSQKPLDSHALFLDTFNEAKALNMITNNDYLLGAVCDLCANRRPWSTHHDRAWQCDHLCPWAALEREAPISAVDLTQATIAADIKPNNVGTVHRFSQSESVLSSNTLTFILPLWKHRGRQWVNMMSIQVWFLNIPQAFGWWSSHIAFANNASQFNGSL